MRNTQAFDLKALGILSLRGSDPVRSRSEAKAGSKKRMGFFSHMHRHSALGCKPPAVVTWQGAEITKPDQQMPSVV
jgi:hypothetical protein